MLCVAADGDGVTVGGGVDDGPGVVVQPAEASIRTSNDTGRVL